eukprot:gb/GECG01006617.1/.p1 GENE.gb/GECG01006617.1/~~gb/GECG01006617.1/.p1  ORF type:complete len:2440 (+),score=322.90 gb/GECG01006617.1/:1-7320(+)
MAAANTGKAGGSSQGAQTLNMQAFMGQNEAQVQDDFGEQSAKQIKKLRERAAQNGSPGSPLRTRSTAASDGVGGGAAAPVPLTDAKQGLSTSENEETVDEMLRADMEEQGQLVTEEESPKHRSKRQRLYELGKLPLRMGILPFHLIRKGFHGLTGHHATQKHETKEETMQEEEAAEMVKPPVLGASAMSPPVVENPNEEEDFPRVLRPLAKIGDPEFSRVDPALLHALFVLTFEAIESPLVSMAKYPPAGYLAAIEAANASASKGVVDNVSDTVRQTLGVLSGVVGYGARALKDAVVDVGRAGRSAVTDTLSLWSNREYEQHSRKRGSTAPTSLDDVQLESKYADEDDDEESLQNKRRNKVMRKQLQAASSVTRLDAKSGNSSNRERAADGQNLDSLAESRFHASGAESLSLGMLRYAVDAFSKLDHDGSGVLETRVLDQHHSVSNTLSEHGQQLMESLQHHMGTSWSLEEYARSLRRAIIKCQRQRKRLNGSRKGFYNASHFDSPASFQEWRTAQIQTLDTAINLYKKYLLSLQPQLQKKRVKPKASRPASTETVGCSCCSFFKKNSRAGGFASEQQSQQENVEHIGDSVDEYDSDEPLTEASQGSDPELTSADRRTSRPCLTRESMSSVKASEKPRALLPVLIKILLAHSNDYGIYCEASHRWECNATNVYDSPYFEKNLKRAQFSISYRISPISQVLLQEYCVHYRISHIRYRTEVLACLSNNLLAATGQRRSLVEEVLERNLDDDMEITSKLKEGKLKLFDKDQKVVHESTLRLYQYYRYLFSVLVDIQTEIRSMAIRRGGRGTSTEVSGWTATETDLRILRNTLRLLVYDCYRIFRLQESFFPIIGYQCIGVHDVAVKKEQERRERSMRETPSLQLLKEYFTDHDELAKNVADFAHANEGDPTPLLLLEVFYRAWSMLQVLSNSRGRNSEAENTKHDGQAQVKLVSTPFVELLAQLTVENNRVKYQDLRATWVNFSSGSKERTSSLSSIESHPNMSKESIGEFLGQNSALEATTNVNTKKTVTVRIDRGDLANVVFGAGGIGGHSAIVLEGPPTENGASNSGENSKSRSSLLPGDEVIKIDGFSLIELDRGRRSIDSDVSDDDTSIPIGALKTQFCQQYALRTLTPWYDTYLNKESFAEELNKKNHKGPVVCEVEREEREASPAGKGHEGPLNCLEVVLGRLQMGGYENVFAEKILGFQNSLTDLSSFGNKFRPVVFARVRKAGDEGDRTRWAVSPVGSGLSCNWEGYKLQFPLDLLKQVEGKCYIDFEIRVPPISSVGEDDGANNLLVDLEDSEGTQEEGEHNDDNETTEYAQRNAFSFLPRAAKFVAHGIGHGIKRTAHYAVALPVRAATSIARTSKHQGKADAVEESSTIEPEEALREKYTFLAGGQVKTYIGPEKKRQPPRAMHPELLKSPVKELENVPLFLEAGIGFSHFSGDSANQLDEDTLSIKSVDSGEDSAPETADAIRETERERLTRLFEESMGKPLTIQQMCLLTLSVTGQLRELESLSFLSSDFGSIAVRSMAYEAFWGQFLKGTYSVNEGSRKKYPKFVPIDITESSFKEYVDALRKYLLTTCQQLWSYFNANTSSLIYMPNLQNVEGHTLRVESFDLPKNKSLSIRDHAQGLGAVVEPVASARTVATSLLLLSLLNHHDSIDDVEQGACTVVKSPVLDAYDSTSSLLFYTSFCTLYSSLRIDVRRGLLSVHPSPSNIVEGIMGEQGIMSLMREIHGVITDKRPPERLPLLNINTVFELYIPGWISARRRKIHDDLVPTAVKMDKLTPLKPEFNVLHSSSAQNVFWFCIEYVRQFKKLPRSSKEENIARFVQHLLVDPLIQYTESQSAMISGIMEKALKDRKHPLQSFWGLGHTSSAGKEILKELCVRINNVFFTKQKLFDLLEKVNDVEGVNVRLLGSSRTNATTSERDSDASEEQARRSRSAAVEALRIYKVDLHLNRAYKLPRMDAGGLGKSDPYAMVEAAGSIDELQAHMTERVETSIIKSTLDPQWNAKLTLVTASSNAFIRISVFDWNSNGEDQFIGSITLPLATLLNLKTHKFHTALRRPRHSREGQDDMIVTNAEECVPFWDQLYEELGKRVKNVGGDTVEGEAEDKFTASLSMNLQLLRSLSDAEDSKTDQHALKRELREWYKCQTQRGSIEFSINFDEVDVGRKAEEAIDWRLQMAITSLSRGMHRHIRPLVVDAVTGDHGSIVDSHNEIPDATVADAAQALLQYLDDQLCTLSELVYEPVTYRVIGNLWQGICIELLYLLLPTMDHDNMVTRPVDDKEREKASKVSKNFFKFWSYNKVNWLNSAHVKLLRKLYFHVKEYVYFEGTNIGLPHEVATDYAKPLEAVLANWDKSVLQLNNDMNAVYDRAIAWANEQKNKYNGSSKIRLQQYRDPTTGMSYFHYREILHYRGEFGKIKEASNRYNQSLKRVSEL